MPTCCVCICTKITPSKMLNSSCCTCTNCLNNVLNAKPNTQITGFARSGFDLLYTAQIPTNLPMVCCYIHPQHARSHVKRVKLLCPLPPLACRHNAEVGLQSCPHERNQEASGQFRSKGEPRRPKPITIRYLRASCARVTDKHPLQKSALSAVTVVYANGSVPLCTHKSTGVKLLQSDATAWQTC